MNDDNSMDVLESLRDYLDSPKLFTRFNVRRVRDGGDFGQCRVYIDDEEVCDATACEDTKREIRLYAQERAAMQRRPMVRVNFRERMLRVANR